MNGMYQNRGRPWGGLVGLAIVLVFLGGIGAVGFANTDLGNFFHARAEAQKMEADTAWEVELRQIDLPYLQAEREAESEAMLAQIEQEARVAEARTKAELDQIEAERAATISAIQERQRVEMLRNNQHLANEAQWSETYVFATRILVMMMAVCSGIAMVLFIKQKLVPQIVNASWKSDDYRKREIRLARSRERQARHSELEQRARLNGNWRNQPRPREGERPYRNLPEAR